MKTRSFSLRFDEEGPDQPRQIDFDGDDPHLAFGIMEREGPDRSATLWEGERRLGKLTRVNQDYWQLS